MTAGLPGTGIGGLFYLLAALLMPFHELVMTVRGKSTIKRWTLVGQQLSIALAIISGIWITGWIVGYLFVTYGKMNIHDAAHGIARFNLLSGTPLAITTVTLVVVMIMPHLLRGMLRLGLFRQQVSEPAEGFQAREREAYYGRQTRSAEIDIFVVDDGSVERRSTKMPAEIL